MSGAYPANRPDRIRAVDGGELLMSCQNNHGRAVYYDNSLYRTFGMGISFIGMRNDYGCNRAEYLRDVLNSLAGYQGLIIGNVVNNITGDPIQGVELTILNTDRRAVTNVSGEFMIDRIPNERFTIRVTKEGMTPYEAELTFNGEREMALDIRMLHPEMLFDIDEIRTNLVENTERNIGLTVTNEGDGPLHIALRPKAVRVFGDFWDPLRTVDVNRITQDNRLQAATFFMDNYWVAGGGGGSNEPNQLYQISRDGELIARYEQASWSSYGWRDLTSDWDYLYGVDSNYIAQISPWEGTVTGVRIPSPCNPTIAVAWDSDNDRFWVASTGTNIFAIDRQGNTVATVRNDRRFRIYGLAYRADDPDGCPLYVMCNNQDANGRLFKVNPQTGQETVVIDIPLFSDERAGGCNFSTEIFPFTTTFILQNRSGVQTLQALETATDFYWLNIDPTEAIIEGFESQIFNITIDAERLELYYTYTAHIQVSHNTGGGEMWVDVEVTIVPTPPNSAGDTGSSPFAFMLEAAYPNPFNSASTLNFTLERDGYANLTLFDITGRELARLAGGEMKAGAYSVLVNVGALPSGVYLAKLSSSGKTAVQKLTLVR